ncbi:MAG TPA: BTAD domain-containing putative transcriptional regulator [Acidimicrobiales bacterium]|nr:BTAD domain-containing putative transcriptional regulator [Acidimicrobiales bacterium]
MKLLGSPTIQADDGVAIALRGHKPWAVLARLALAERPVSRRELAVELFPDADDPLGALRWSLAAIRKALGSPCTFVGDPIDHRLPDDVTVDVVDLRAGRLHPDDAGGELLEGVDPRCGPEFATWLLVVREQVAASIDALLREAGVAALARGDHDAAIRVAERLVRRATLDEGAHVLLLRSLVAAGRVDAAHHHAVAVEATFLRELGMLPSPAIRAASQVHSVEPVHGVSIQAQCAALLEAGRAAVQAGAVDAGVVSLRRAAACADQTGDPALQSEALLSLGSALVRSVRGFDDEGDIVLGRAAAIAHDAGITDTAAVARSEQAYLDALAGRRLEAERHLAEAQATAGDDAGLLAAIRAVGGFNLAEAGEVDAALERYEDALGHARAAGDQRREGWVLGLGAWMLLHAQRPDEAGAWAERSRSVVARLGWASFEPLLAAIDAELDLRVGERPRSADTSALERSFAMSCELADPCWEGATARSIALQVAAQGDLDAALRWITEARARSTRKPDPWAGLVCVVLLTEVELRRSAGQLLAAGAAARDALSLAARAHLDGLLPRAVEAVTGEAAAPLSPAAAAPAPPR